MKTRLTDLAAEAGTTDRTLRRALRQGLVRGRRLSPRTVDLPLAERTYIRRVWPLLSSLRESLRTEPSVSLAVLFGSRARGDEHPSSDVDVLVSFRRDADSRRLAARLSERIAVRVEVVLLEDACRAPILLAEILKEGRVLVDREGTWPALLEQEQRIEQKAKRAQQRINRELSATFDFDRAT